jgi:hypothetical protein
MAAASFALTRFPSAIPIQPPNPYVLFQSPVALLPSKYKHPSHKVNLLWRVFFDLEQFRASAARRVL